MDATEFVKNDLGKNIAKGDRIQNLHYTGDEWIDIMEQYAEYKAKNLNISEVIKCSEERLKAHQEGFNEGLAYAKEENNNI